ncbi:diguanylate cyclase [Halorubrum sp. 48-1-W]|uniref:two-component system sensor histidine kinase NtrB n=1 Tax=Halorubrum sp. 48-1-W TaxID=2249761 RepID=UPI000DCBDAE0|nr:PAS domain-containing sensor histidine kinase [Halorubrum sp. 48-1-W]RAW45763.1 diguanylate cyclase [Halorubrum sp. 48-1-W]
MTSATEGSSYRPHVENVPIGIFEVNRHGEYVEVNETACEMVGYSRAELLEMSTTELIPEGDDPGDAVSLVGVRETGHMRAERQIQHKDGRTVDVLLETVDLEDGRYIVYVQDITEQKEYERQLEQQRDNLEVLNQVLRHDVRNDLQLVTAYADLLSEKCEDDEVSGYITTIQESANHAVELTSTAREMADVMLSVTQESQQIDLRTVLETEVSEVQSSYPNAAITFGTTVPSVTIDANEMISSVFRNLVKNAIQHNDKPLAEVTVSVTVSDECATIRVADNGPGIPDDRKEAIFGKGDRNLESAGTGLGLYLVETLVDSYRGDVWVEDNDPDGAVFVVELPKAG